MVERKQYNVLELFSGIGGMRYAFNEGVGTELGLFKGSFDVNNIANTTYEYNFKEKPKTTNLDSMTSKQYNKFQPDIILMSPPCQPYTRTGNKKNMEDARSISFLNFLNALKDIPTLKYFLIENVFGFECSKTRELLVNKCDEAGFIYQEYLINPKDLNIPNSRLRYYFIAKRKDLGTFKISDMNQRLFTTNNTLNFDDKETTLKPLNEEEDKELINQIYSTLFNIQQNNDKVSLLDYLGEEMLDLKLMEKYQVSEKNIEKYFNVYDIVEPKSTNTCCFTKGYTHYAQATGSILKLNIKDENANKEILKYRYFTEYEIAKLMGFPTDKQNKLQFPAEVGLRNRYRLLGNSLNVMMVAKLINYMLC